jgi:RNA polymerase sigma-70 factor (ECF subfamily)
MRNLTFTDVERLEALTDEGEVALQMDEDAFRAFYDRTARSVWLYLTRLTRDAQHADDLLQETYYRFLRTEREYASDAHRRNYLFRIATNLVRDGHRRRHMTLVPLPDESGPGALCTAVDEDARAVHRADLGRAMAQLKPRERALLWLAYSQGSSHIEIAESLGVRTSSVKALLFRARRRLAGLLRGPGS